MLTDSQLNIFTRRKKCTKTPSGISGRPCGAKDNFQPEHTLQLLLFLIFFIFKRHPAYHETLSKDSRGLCILSGILQPKSIPHLVQCTESHDTTGSGKGKKETGERGEGGRATSFLHLEQYCSFSSRTDRTQQLPSLSNLRSPPFPLDRLRSCLQESRTGPSTPFCTQTEFGSLRHWTGYLKWDFML